MVKFINRWRWLSRDVVRAGAPSSVGVATQACRARAVALCAAAGVRLSRSPLARQALAQSVLGPFGWSRASPGVVSQTAEPRLRRRLAAGLAAACPVRDERYFITHKAEAAARCGSACGVPRQFASACLLVFLPLLLSGWWWAWGEQERGMMGMWDVYAAGATPPLPHRRQASPPPPIRARAIVRL